MDRYIIMKFKAISFNSIDNLYSWQLITFSSKWDENNNRASLFNWCLKLWLLLSILFLAYRFVYVLSLILRYLFEIVFTTSVVRIGRKLQNNDEDIEE